MDLRMGKKCVPSFAKGIHVLVVDQDKRSLQSITLMLQNCSFKVTTAEEANAALTMIMEEKSEPFNLVMADATEANMNGLLFLHETGTPIILMSAEANMRTAGKSIAEWGCHFLEKPISMEDIEFAWQLVYRKIRSPRAKNSEVNANQLKKCRMGGTFGRIVNVARGVEWNSIEEQEHEENGGKRGGREAKMKPSVTVFDYLETTKINVEEKTNKRSRIVWSSKLHRKFTEALSKLGNRKSSPKIILKMMNEPTLTLRQVASHLQKFKSQVKHLNKITASDASTSLSRNRPQQLPAKRNSMTSILGQPNYSSNIKYNLKQLQVPSCLNGPRLPSSQAVVNCHFKIKNQNNSNSYQTTQPNDLQPETYGRFEGTNLVEDNCIFTDDLYMNDNLQGFLQTSQSNCQYVSADEDCPFLLADNHYLDAVQDLEFAQNLAGSLDIDNITWGAHSVTAGSLNQNVALKELDNLLNNTEEDPMVYCCYDGEMNSFDIDQYSEWLNA